MLYKTECCYNNNKTGEDDQGRWKGGGGGILCRSLTLMPVTYGPTSWMRHVVCEVGSKKLDATWGVTRYDFSPFS